MFASNAFLIKIINSCNASIFTLVIAATKAGAVRFPSSLVSMKVAPCSSKSLIISGQFLSAAFIKASAPFSF